MNTEERRAVAVCRDLAIYLSERWEGDNNKKLRRRPKSCFPNCWMLEGENAGLLCVVHGDVRQFQGVEFPEQYYAKCVHYMAVTGAERWYLAALVFQHGVFYFEIKKEE